MSKPIAPQAPQASYPSFDGHDVSDVVASQNDFEGAKEVYYSDVDSYYEALEEWSGLIEAIAAEAA